MKRLVSVTLLLGLLPAGLARGSTPAGPLRRFALVAGANRGAADRVPLRYAVLDAERFAEVVTRMGGVAPDDRIVLREPTRQAFLDALNATAERAGQAMAGSQRVEVLVYFSGHADDQGLMLGRETLPYRELRAAVGAISAHVGITILDACASGAITRLKGGQNHPAFLSDLSHVVQGYAFLASSSENEAAQESERLRGSFFTHALLTGLRGAADTSGDGKVTLNEAYQFAFQETLVQTAATQGGTQHPAYDIKMAGTGDVVMTDVRQTSSSLVLGVDYEGRFLVLNARRHLVAELFKPQGRQVELALEPGAYEVYYEQRPQVLKTSVTMADGQRQELLRADLKPTPHLPTQRRGPDQDAGAPPPRRAASPLGIRLAGESFGPEDGGLGFRPRIDLVFQPTDRLSLRPHVGFG
ncbi:MAG TPA: caspase family protein, partial [Vicinamibacteria bacterium]